MRTLHLSRLAAAALFVTTLSGTAATAAIGASTPAGAASLPRHPAAGAARDRARPARRLDAMLRSGCLVGEPAARARTELRAAHARVRWHGTGFVTAARTDGPAVISIFLSPRRPAGHDRAC